MYSPCRAASLLGALLLLAGCDRETRESRGTPVAETTPLPPTTDFSAGQPQNIPPDPRAKLYEGNAFHIGQGQALFTQMNCVGCHAHGGGAIGPPLMDDEWRYGGRIEQIVASIVQGRPNGMPSWQGKLTEQQIWELAAYVRSMSGLVPKDVPPSRADAMSSTEPLTLTEQEPVRTSSAASVVGTAQ